MDQFTTFLREICRMSKSLNNSRFYALWAVGALVAIGYLLKAVAVLITALH